MKLTEITQKKAESDFLFGDCASFAIAFQELFGGDLYSLDRNNKPLHIFVKVNGKNIDVKGVRGTYSMVMSIVGSADGFSVEGPYNKENLPCRKPNPRKIKMARDYIVDNPRIYNVS